MEKIDDWRKSYLMFNSLIILFYPFVPPIRSILSIYLPLTPLFLSHLIPIYSSLPILSHPIHPDHPVNPVNPVHPVNPVMSLLSLMELPV